MLVSADGRRSQEGAFLPRYRRSPCARRCIPPDSCSARRGPPSTPLPAARPARARTPARDARGKRAQPRPLRPPRSVAHAPNGSASLLDFHWRPPRGSGRASARRWRSAEGALCAATHPHARSAGALPRIRVSHRRARPAPPPMIEASGHAATADAGRRPSRPATRGARAHAGRARGAGRCRIRWYILLVAAIGRQPRAPRPPRPAPPHGAHPTFQIGGCGSVPARRRPLPPRTLAPPRPPRRCGERGSA